MKQSFYGYKSSYKPTSTLRSSTPTATAAYKPRSIRKIENKTRRNLFISVIATVGLVVVVIFWGLPALIGWLSVFNKLKPTDKAATATVDEAISPPVLNIPFEATNSATINISGYSQPNTTVEIYFDSVLKDSEKTANDGTFQTKQLALALGNNNIYGVTITSDGRKSHNSKEIPLVYNNQKPTLNLSTPADGTIITDPSGQITVAGTTDVNDSITVNGITLIVDNQGNFSETLTLQNGSNTITVIATDTVGNTNQIVRTVTFNPPTPSPSPSESPAPS